MFRWLYFSAPEIFEFIGLSFFFEVSILNLKVLVIDILQIVTRLADLL